LRRRCRLRVLQALAPRPWFLARTYKPQDGLGMDCVTMNALLELPQFIQNLVVDLHKEQPQAFLVAVAVGLLLGAAA
jgi:hypothetical protein